MSEQRVPCVEGLFSEEGGAKLHGSRCTTCSTPYFPKTATCHNPDCTQSAIVPDDFGGRGVLWSYSVADFPPPPPHKFDQPFKSYAMGVVDMECGLRLIGQMVDEAAAVKIGSAVELVIDTLYHEDGKAFTTWKFKQL
ncbi:MAG: OB-fold domain-containing protein [Rubrivivax sp.]|jgi:uncharacterized OB-fold protein|nr:OB-fold domain-containing protein [Rubrivivax sp.]